MSGFDFLSAYVGVKGQQLQSAVIAHWAARDPAGMSEAQLVVEEKELDQFNLEVVTPAQTALNDAKKAWAASDALYHTRMSAAELLDTRAGAEQDPTKKKGLETSRDKMMADLERDEPAHTTAHKGFDEALAFFTEMDGSYQQRAKQLRTARDNLKRGAQEMQQAQVRARQAEFRAQAARQAAGLSQQGNGINFAMDAFGAATKNANEQADANNRKARALAQTDAEHDDPNIASALAAVSGTAKPEAETFAQRMARLKGETPAQAA